MSNTTDMNTETENITTIIKEETGLTIEEPKRRKRQLKKAAEPSMKEATELAEGKTLVIKEEEKAEDFRITRGETDPVLTLTEKQKAEIRSDEGLRIYAQLRVEHDKWMKLYLELKEKTDPLLAKLEQQRQKRNEASKKSKKVSREKDKKVKTELEERVKKLEEKVLEKDFKEVLVEDGDCENCGDPYAEHGCSAEKCWFTHKCADCDNHADDIGDGNDEDGNELNPLCSECRKKYEDEEKSDTDEEKVYHECSNCKGDMCDQYGWCVNCMKRTEKTIQK